MSGLNSHSTSLPDPSGPFDDRFVYRLTDEGKKVLAEHERSNGKPAFSQARCTSAVAEALDAEARRERQRQRSKDAWARGVRAGTICARWRDGGEVPELRLAGRWLEDTGFGLGQEYEVEVGIGRLIIHTV
jgi:hypothetical protein